MIPTRIDAPASNVSSLDLDRLENVCEYEDKIIARCPACAEEGHDSKGEHLCIASDGRFGCVAFPAEEGVEHRKRIFALVGKRTTKTVTFTSADEAARCCTPPAATLEDVYLYPRDGKPFGAVARYKVGSDKTFRQLHAEGAGWATGAPDGQWPLFGVESLPSDGQVFVVEGEKCQQAAARAGLCAVTSSGGAKASSKSDWTALAGRDVIILPDNDDPGEAYATTVARTLVGLTPPARVRIVRLPGLEPGGDIADYLQAGGKVEDILSLVASVPEWDSATAGDDAQVKPDVLLPQGEQSISATGDELGKLMAATDHYFIRGGAVVQVEQSPDGKPQLKPIKAETLASEFEKVAALRKIDKKGNVVATVCVEQTAKVIAASSAFRDVMPPIHVITPCPVLIERDGVLIPVSRYDRDSGIYATGSPAEEIDLDEARRLLAEMLVDFNFATTADRARALAAIITPALVFGGLLRGRAPVDLGEADASQSGKGFRAKLTAALYAQSVKTVTQKKGGVGSMEESFNMALIRGSNFISLDNIRGKVDCPGIESFLTEDNYLARVPNLSPVEIDPRRTVVMMTSNKADLTIDLANRSSCVRILKQPETYAFKTFAEGDILEHIRANQPRYLAAVFAVIRAWHAAGKLRTEERRHDFRPWAQTLDWITQNLLDAGPLLDGHRETQDRMANPALNWLRDVAIEVIRDGRYGVWLRTSELVDLAAFAGIEIPGLPEGGDLTNPETRKSVNQAVGIKIKSCFRTGDTLTIDGMVIERREQKDQTYNSVKEYRFVPVVQPTPGPGKRDQGPTPPANPVQVTSQTEPKSVPPSYSPANDPADRPANKTHITANTASTSVTCDTNSKPTEGKEDILPLCQPSAGLAGLAATPSPAERRV
jgi:hypothetical protein